MSVWKKRIEICVRKAAVLLCLACLLTCFCVSQVSGAQNAQITVTSCSAEPNSSVSLAVRLDGNPGLWGLKLRIGYDSSAVTLDAVDAGGLFSENELTYSESLSKNPYVIVASRGKLEDLTGDGTIVTLTFSVKTDAQEKAYPVTVEIAQSVNVAGESVSIAAASGSISVVECLHQVKQWVTSEAATCEKTGTEALICKKCTAVFETRSLPTTDHLHTEVRGAVAATQTQTGYTGDTYCTDCGKKIAQGEVIAKLPAQPEATQPPESKPEATQPPESKPEATQPPESKPEETESTGNKPQITSGDRASFRMDSDEPLVFVSDARYEDFIRVEVDGMTIHADRYTVKSGSTIVTLRQDYLKTLDVGAHTVSIVSTTGTATAGFTIEEAVTQPEESEASETVASPTEAPETVPDDTASEPVQHDEGSASGSGTVILIVIIAACLLCAGVVVVVIMKKRRGKHAA